MSNLSDFITYPNFWNDSLEKEFATVAMSYYPNEAICLVTKNGVELLENISDNPENEFIVDLTTEQMEKGIGIIHSHPDSDIRPSKSDYSTYIGLDMPFGIMPITADHNGISYWIGEHLLEKPLEGRPFIHGYYDCYSLIRAYFHQELSITINDYAREDDWWNRGEDLYGSYFTDAGFKVVNTIDGINIGDVILMKIHSPVINHAAIYLGDNKILHHLYGRLSRVDVFSNWAKVIEKVVRYSND